MRTSGRPWLWVAVGAALAQVSCRAVPTAGATSGPLAPGSALDLKLPRYPSGELFDLSQERGRVVLLEVWATWCEPCRETLPLYQALLKEYGPRGLSLYAVNVDADLTQVASFLAALNVSLPVLADKDARVAERNLRVRVMPTTFLLDKRGIVRHVHEGFAENRLMQLQTEIDSLLAESAP